jgi:nuclear transport factor 2 (NTF2) superfamily protein
MKVQPVPRGDKRIAKGARRPLWVAEEGKGARRMSVPIGQQISVEEATRMVQDVQDAYNAADVERIVAGFTDDVVIRFGDVPEIRGKDEAEKFIRARFARIKDYKLRKTLRAVMGNVVGVYWDGTWEDLKTGKLMNVRGTEFWTVRDGKVADWEATVNVWEAGKQPANSFT